MTFEQVDAGYEKMFCNMVFNPAAKSTVYSAVRLILSYRNIYESIAADVNKGMPWYFVSILHYRESGCNMTRHLHNGNTLKLRTTSVPKGRPIAAPRAGFPKGYTFQESAIDALTMPGQNFQLETEWNLNRMLYRFEKWNGFGYVRLAKKYPGQGITNPYLWNGTMYYSTGKYAQDGHYDPKLKDAQCGGAILLRYLTDKTLGFV